jgi:hypothetical protein
VHSRLCRARLASFFSQVLDSTRVGNGLVLMLFEGLELSFLIFLAQSSDIRKWFMKGQDKNGVPAKASGAAGDKKKLALSIPEMKAAPSMVGCWPRAPIVILSALRS